ncbi:NAD(P)H-quinone oxidoreductase subunit F [Aetokthonos hydrillicola Thurmond2011]|jgi:NAD(P)H-quinone oxidoreductase subunit 5|uniref:NAD(P)H-quinone oxidoreductase subunit F n=2 Tax=Aetokthonos TaxID=1550243 RepID=A0AAP5IB42_9CYAN|nr:NAD(P)H-quinone oxidoreductase subunit F [Aetokthonos hydrillicola]MBO3460691.1 NAD(P)H-quinone oxidoreductase subunit F [Aetokthonos hydrillicola CCALA 1050]MBW4587689.1 NAD(P)H-quinone oxidoreductase subunit F [Aetokthonos hydrillicola CCALA 1050]MDR9897929.1 NAD(P)H-quinone oxidoreductase subunit F [Aetokthonos hydrillicola Thurmond2011]
MTEFFIQTSWLIPFYGLLGAIFAVPWAIGMIQRTGPRPAAYGNILMTLCAYIHGSVVFSAIWNQPSQHLTIHWFQIADLDLSFALEISSLSVGSMQLVTGLSLLAQLFALGYMEKDYALARFFALMGFFEGAMSGLALSNSLLLSYCFLELLTLSTYLLVGFWYAQPLVVKASRDAFLTKRVGDVLLLMGVVVLSTLVGSSNFPDLYEWAKTANLPPISATLLCLTLLAGPTGKCAQFPLHLWLDEAMEAPSPASVLRNSLVVSCGGYVLVTLQPILAISPVAMATLVTIGTVTAIGSSLVAIAQIDIKRALSHSTSAYMGLVFIAVGMQYRNFALMLILVHAIAKALMFMSVGSVITTTNSQNLTEMGGLGKTMPITASGFVVGAAGLIGLLPLGGFWAMQQGIDHFWLDSPWLVGVLLLINALTAFNFTRVFRLVFLGSSQAKTRCAPEISWQMALPMLGLIATTLSVPAMLRSLNILPFWMSLNQHQVILHILSGVLGCVLGNTITLQRTWLQPKSKTARFFHNLLAYDFYIEQIYRFSVILAVTQFSKFTNWLDSNLVDKLVNLVGLTTQKSGQSLKYSTSGLSQSYVLTIFLGISILTGFISWKFFQVFNISEILSIL